MKSLLLGLGILGSSSVALADHDNWSRRYDRYGYREARFDQRYDLRYDDRYDQRYEPRVERMQPRTSWLALSSAARLDRGQDFVDLRGSRERFSQLRLQNQTGRMHVRAIEIVFANGERQLVRCDRVLDGNYGMINVDLTGGARRIDHIIVDGRAGRGSSYQLYAM